MFDSEIEKTIVSVAVILWFAHGWYLNIKMLAVHKKLDVVLGELNGLRQYLYEIDPQFDDERQSRAAFARADDEKDIFAGMNDCFLVKQKEDEGKRTLNTRFSE